MFMNTISRIITFKIGNTLVYGTAMRRLETPRYWFLSNAPRIPQFIEKIASLWTPKT